MNDQLQALGAQHRIPADPLVSRFETPDGRGPKGKSDPSVTPANDLREGPSLGAAGAKEVFGFKQIAEALPGRFLGKDVRGQRWDGLFWCRLSMFHPIRKWARGSIPSMKIANPTPLNHLEISTKKP